DYRWLSAATTHVGAVREVNEDNQIEKPEIGLWVVADGMGGHSAGDLASGMVVDELSAVRRTGSNEEFIERVIEVLSITNQKLRQLAFQKFDKQAVMGTTVVVLIIHENRFTILWAGDSRVYRYRNHRLQQLTRDHSQVNDMLDSGLLAEEEAEDHPLANVITRAIGASQTLNLDRIDGDIQHGDIFMLCSDGLNKELTDQEISAFFSSGDVDEINKALIHSALVRGAQDNITAISVRVEGTVANDQTIPALSGQIGEESNINGY
ncbi:MAG: serine/threonine-protein phosphatase, partial [Kangiella sp.]|nr:serine/threonine-protein phosphatase [Kangiella sp.]